MFLLARGHGSGSCPPEKEILIQDHDPEANSRAGETQGLVVSVSELSGWDADPQMGLQQLPRSLCTVLSFGIAADGHADSRPSRPGCTEAA